MAKNYPNLGKILKRLLFERDMKPMDLARELNIPQPTIHRLVSGKSTRPYKSSLDPIANYFSITTSQLVGEKPLDSETTQQYPSLGGKIITVPLLNWNDLPDLSPPSSNEGGGTIMVGNVSKKAFALTMPDSSMEPLFPEGSILIFDPENPIKDRSYVVVFIRENKTAIFRQLLIDLDHKYLKPINPDLSVFKMRLLSESDIVIASLIESRLNHRLGKSNDVIGI